MPAPPDPMTRTSASTCMGSGLTRILASWANRYTDPAGAQTAGRLSGVPGVPGRAYRRPPERSTIAFYHPAREGRSALDRNRVSGPYLAIDQITPNLTLA